MRKTLRRIFKWIGIIIAGLIGLVVLIYVISGLVRMSNVSTATAEMEEQLDHVNTNRTDYLPLTPEAIEALAVGQGNEPTSWIECDLNARAQGFSVRSWLQECELWQVVTLDAAGLDPQTLAGRVDGRTSERNECEIALLPELDSALDESSLAMRYLPAGCEPRQPHHRAEVVQGPELSPLTSDSIVVTERYRFSTDFGCRPFTPIFCTTPIDDPIPVP